jgi:RNA polymerase-binding transcription factor DksA
LRALVAEENSSPVKEANMNQLTMDDYLTRLTTRRQQIVATLRHLDKQQNEVEQNTDWLDQAAQKNRVELLDRLNDWYESEMAEIDKALERIRLGNYGTCPACHNAIDAARLASAPAAEFCAPCQATREQLTAG